MSLFGLSASSDSSEEEFNRLRDGPPVVNAGSKERLLSGTDVARCGSEQRQTEGEMGGLFTPELRCFPKKQPQGGSQPAVYPPDGPKRPNSPPNTRGENITNPMRYALFGYLTGILLVILWYLVNFHKEGGQLSFKWFVIVLAGLLLFVVLYNRETKCVSIICTVFLLGRIGRELIVIFIFFLAIWGPLMNILNNIEIMAYSLSCGQTLLKNALTPMHEIMGAPVYVVEQAVYSCLSQVRKIMEELDCVLHHFESYIQELYSNYKECNQWLLHQQSFFENQMGSPYDRCQGAAMTGTQDCKLKFKDDPSVCKLERRFEWFCGNLRDLPSFFDTHLQDEQQIADQIFSQPLEMFTRIRAMFEVSITFDHNDTSNGELGTLSSDLDQLLASELLRQTVDFRYIHIWLQLMLFVLFVTLILTAVLFRINYLGSNLYQNFYLTREFYKYNNMSSGGIVHNILPLYLAERRDYIRLWSTRHLPVEWRHFNSSLVFLIIISVQVLMLCLLDDGLSWFMVMMARHSHDLDELQPPEYTKLVIKKGGKVGDILRGLVHAFEPLSKNLIVDIQHCVPVPLPPKIVRYWEIAMMLLLAFCLLYFQPFITRLSHIVMSFFHPELAVYRAELLHNCIQRNRDRFVKFARRRAYSRKFYYTEHCRCLTTILTRISAISYRLSDGRLGAYKGKYCFLCKSGLLKTDHLECETPTCPGVYCHACFMDMNYICFVCNPLLQYGDTTDISDVEDSSDDPEGKPYRPCHRKHCHSNVKKTAKD